MSESQLVYHAHVQHDNVCPVGADAPPAIAALSAAVLAAESRYATDASDGAAATLSASLAALASTAAYTADELRAKARALAGCIVVMHGVECVEGDFGLAASLIRDMLYATRRTVVSLFAPALSAGLALGLLETTLDIAGLFPNLA